MAMQKIRPFLWFDKEAEEAAKLYVSIFKNSRVTEVMRYGASGPGPTGSVMTVAFVLDGQEFIALNGGPHFHFTEAVSMFVTCEDQAEVDFFWDKLIEGGGQPSHCRWLKDRFGLSWQIVPAGLMTMLHDSNPERSGRVMQAMLQMGKLDIAALQRAHAGE
jgi:predicted 3-demethylubiquinone-9 3-methyltransferase (glyoxalase superfamily)